MNINKALKALNRLDWFVAAGTVAVGLYLLNYWVIGSGLIGLAAAWYKPADRIKARLEKKFLRKKTQPSDTAKTLQEDAFYAEMLGQAGDAGAAAGAEPAKPADYRGNVPLGALHLSQNPYSVVRYQHFNLAAATENRTWA